ncbi:MAG: DUF3367 domain-containing protein [Nitrososphaerota archaeon]|nr:DUF3367 domain-containing protein [Nitrososphaerota archaeon]MDG7024397.1 DUF3367 domain-containing protein [Nitrososphaerota archaeon]
MQKWLSDLLGQTNHYRDWIPLAVTTIFVSAASFSWFRYGYLYASGDVSTILDLSHALKFLYAWDVTGGLGHASSSTVTFTFAAFFGLLKCIGIPLWASEVLFYVLLVTWSFIAMFFFTRCITGNWLASLLASVFYVFNLYNVVNILPPVYTVGLAVTPTLLFAVSKGVANPTNPRFILIGLVTAVPLSFLFADPPLFLATLFLVFAFALYRLFVSRDRSASLRFLIVFSTVITGASLWWLLPTLWNLHSGSLIVTAVTPLSASAFVWVRATVLNVLRLSLDWGWATQAYWSFSTSFYDNPLMVAFSVVPCLIAVLAVLTNWNSRATKSLVGFFSAITILSLIMQIGPNAPTGALYGFLYSYVPYFWLFRDPKFGIPLLLGYSALIALAFSATFRSMPPHYKVVTVTVFLVITVALSYPMFNGQVITPTFTTGAPAFVKVPSYWNQASSWLSSQNPDAIILVLPPDQFYQVGFNWNFYGGDPTSNLLDVRTIIPTPPPSPYGGGFVTNTGSENITGGIYDAVLHNDSEALSALIVKSGIQFILLRGDMNYTMLSLQGLNTSLTLMQALVSRLPNIGSPQIFGDLLVYPITNPAPMVGAEGNVSITYDELNPTTYCVKTNATSPFTLVLRDSYDPGWHVYNGTVSWPGLLLQPSISSEITGGFDNSWKIVSVPSGTLTVYYQPEAISTVGELGSVVSVAVTLIVLIGLERWPRTDRENRYHSRVST